MYQVEDKVMGEIYWAIKDGLCNTMAWWLTRRNLKERLEHLYEAHTEHAGDAWKAARVAVKENYKEVEWFLNTEEA